MATLNSVQHFPCPPLPQSPRPAQKSNHPFLFIANVHKRLKLGNSWADASQFSPNAIGINLVLLGYSLLLCNPLQSFCDQWHESSVWVRLRDPTFTYHALSCDPCRHDHGGSEEGFRELFRFVHFEAFLQQCKLFDEWNSILQ